jgi:chemotaxis protein MotB
MKNTVKIVSIFALAGLALGGCANQKVDNLEEINRTNAARIEQLNQENRTLEAMIDRKDSRIGELEGEVRQLRGVKGELDSQLGSLRDQQRSIQDAFGNLRLGGLNPETDRALQALAAANSDLIRYDSARGMLQFTSDLTFDAGSDVVKAQAVASLQKLAQILMSSAASEYDLRVVGHTDNQRIANPATAKKFGTNRHLSAYRAIAVEEVLRQAGMPGSRVEIAGWGEYRPVVANSSRGGTAANRRVEIYVVPSAASTGTASAEVGESAPSAPEVPMK